jgi:hypothetical protein
MQPATRRLVQFLAAAAGFALLLLGSAHSRFHSSAFSGVAAFLAAGACFLLASRLSSKPDGDEGLPRHRYFWGRVALLFLAVLGLLAYGISAMMTGSL